MRCAIGERFAANRELLFSLKHEIDHRLIHQRLVAGRSLGPAKSNVRDEVREYGVLDKPVSQIAQFW